MKRITLKNILLGLSGLRVMSALFLSFTYFSGPHVIRQIDTLGVSLRYYMRFLEGESLSTFLLPAVLSAGDSFGISPMEFPFLNFLLFPFFSVNTNFVRFIHLLILFGLTLLNFKIWKGVEKEGVKIDSLFLFLPIYSISQVYIDKFMPDYLAFVLICLAMGMRLGDKKYHCFFAFLFASLGLLIKPPVVVAFGPLLFLMDFRQLGKEILKWIMPAFVISILYYTLGIDYLERVTDVPPYFATQFRNPMMSLRDAFSEPKLLTSFLLKDLFTAFTLVPILCWSIYRQFFLKKEGIPLFLWAVLLLQVICIFALDGKHLYHHTYYAIGCSLLCLFIFFLFLKRCKQRCLKILVVLAVFINQMETIVHRAKPLRKNHLARQCDQIRDTIDFSKIKKIRTTRSSYPTLGLCLGVIQNSESARYGVFFKTDKNIPQNKVLETKDLFVVDYKSEKEK